jgi:hypothetical protein
MTDKQPAKPDTKSSDDEPDVTPSPGIAGAGKATGTPGPADGAPNPGPPDDPYGLAARLRAQAAALEAEAPPTDEYVRMKVEPPHTSFGYGGVEIGNEWTAVHVSLAPGVLRAAAAHAGVTVTQEG